MREGYESRKLRYWENFFDGGAANINKLILNNFSQNSNAVISLEHPMRF